MHEINVLHLHSVQRRLAREPAFVEAQARVQEVVVIVIVFYCIKVSSTRSITYCTSGSITYIHSCTCTYCMHTVQVPVPGYQVLYMNVLYLGTSNAVKA